MQSLESVLNFFVVLAFIAAFILQQRKKRTQQDPQQEPAPDSQESPAAMAEAAAPPREYADDAAPVALQAHHWGRNEPRQPQQPRPLARRHGLPFADRSALRQAIATMTVLAPCRALDPYKPPSRQRTAQDD